MYEYRVRRIIKVVDGDTIDCEIELGFGLTASFRFRLYGADAPEMFGAKATPEGLAAKVFTEQWLAGRAGKVLVRTRKAAEATVGIGDGVYGRWLAEFEGPHWESLAVDLAAAGFDREHPL